MSNFLNELDEVCPITSFNYRKYDLCMESQNTEIGLGWIINDGFSGMSDKKIWQDGFTKILMFSGIFLVKYSMGQDHAQFCHSGGITKKF